jgi:hypothetical protein
MIILLLTIRVIKAKSEFFAPPASQDRTVLIPCSHKEYAAKMDVLCCRRENRLSATWTACCIVGYPCPTGRTFSSGGRGVLAPIIDQLSQEHHHGQPYRVPKPSGATAPQPEQDSKEDHDDPKCQEQAQRNYDPCKKHQNPTPSAELFDGKDDAAGYASDQEKQE